MMAELKLFNQLTEDKTKDRQTTIPVIFIPLAVLFLTSAPLYLFKSGKMTAVSPANILSAGIAILLFQCVAIGNTGRKDMLKLITGYFNIIYPLIGIGLLYALYFFIGYYYKTQNPAQDIFLLLFSMCSSIVVLFYLLCFNIKLNVVSAILEIAFLAIVITVFIDIVSPLTFSEFDTRPAGFPQNPNIASYRIVTLMCLLLMTDIPVYRKAIYLILGVSGAFITFSRGGLLLMGMLFTFLIITNFKRISEINFLKILGSIAAIASIIYMMYAVVDFKPLKNVVDTDYTSHRLYMLSSVNTIIDKDDSRLDLANIYFEKGEDSPYFGNGALQAKNENIYIEGPHDMYILVWFEFGLPGLLLYLLFLFRLLKGALLLKSVMMGIFWISLLVYSIFSHNLIFDYFFLFASPLIYYYVIKAHTEKEEHSTDIKPALL